TQQVQGDPSTHPFPLRFGIKRPTLWHDERRVRWHFLRQINDSGRWGLWLGPRGLQNQISKSCPRWSRTRIFSPFSCVSCTHCSVLIACRRHSVTVVPRLVES